MGIPAVPGSRRRAAISLKTTAICALLIGSASRYAVAEPPADPSTAQATNLAPAPSPAPSTDSAPPASATAPAPPAAPAAAQKPSVALPPETAAAPAEAAAASRFSARVRGARIQGERAVSDFNVSVGALRVIPRQSAADLLTLAPGILLTNEGGTGHAQRVFLRGFDAREGQDIEFTVGGVPINEVATAHGQGYADTNFILPELVEGLRIIEGPFDPHQGDFAVAGSAEYQLGVGDDGRGLRVSYRGGSWNSHRLLMLWAPVSSTGYGLGNSGTFGAVELAQSDGFGPNRFSQRATGTAQYELRFGETGRLRILAMTYAARFQSAGVVREDDYESGRKGFFDTYDSRQGGDSQRHSLSGEILGRVGPVFLTQQVFVTLRELRIRENFTGFISDPQLYSQANRGEDPQRGDLLDQHTNELTVGARGSLRLQTPIRGLLQRIEAGYYARYDRTDATQQRLRDPSRGGTGNTPYRTDFSFAAGEADIAGYLDTELHITRYVTLRGGVRGDFFVFDVQNRCAVQNVAMNGAPLDAECYSIDRYGYRAPTERSTATGLAIQPRATLQVEPLRGLVFSGSYGHGARSADPLYLGDGNDAPFASIRAAEGGALFHRTFGTGFGPLEANLRGAFFYTHVAGDLVFNQTVGRNTLAGGTTRIGALFAGRVTTPFLDAAVHVTWARATFDDDGLLVPYVPELVLRADLAAHGTVPRLRIDGAPVVATAGIGLTYVAPRPLPLSEHGDAYVLLDLSARLRWRFVEAGLSIENLLDRRYRLSEFNYVSDFRSQAFPTQVASRHFVAGAPLGIFGTVTLYLDSLLGRVRERLGASRARS